VVQVLIATPTAGGTVKARFAVTLFKVAAAIRDAGWRAEFASLDGSSIVAARNYFANLVLRRAEFTHLLMIDSDMAFEGGVARRLLDAGRPVAAAAYAKRSLDLRRFAAAAARDPASAPEALAALALRYNVLLEPGRVEIQDGMCRALQVALGCAAIRRDALEGMVAAGAAPARPDRILQALGLEGPVHDFFGEITLEDGDRLSEDYSFCRRWRGAAPGNEIWVLVDQPIGHIGEMVYGAPYLDRLRHGLM
jgi:hypothetical protein